MRQGMLTHVYIYYRVRPEQDVEIARASVAAMQAAVARRTGVQGRLMQRADDATTWMEVYEDVGDRAAFMVVLEAEAVAHRLADLVAEGAARHVEHFVEPR
ncbi:hypothetical protein C664_01775 [Thauera sp. 63]|nr:hypothetical protein C664_01775 [Thauera sp. 63]